MDYDVLGISMIAAHTYHLMRKNTGMIRDRAYGLRTYTKCFVGAEFSDLLGRVLTEELPRKIRELTINDDTMRRWGPPKLKNFDGTDAILDEGV